MSTARSTTDTFYRKIGRKYVLASFYDQNVHDAFPIGNHLVMVYKDGSTRRFNITPALAPMIAAGRYCEDVISKRIMKATELRPSTTRPPITQEQKDCWVALAKSFGQETYALEWPSAHEAAQEAVAALTVEAEKLLGHPMVRDAYDEFMATCKLVADQQR
jgi:hypothetical protein